MVLLRIHSGSFSEYYDREKNSFEAYIILFLSLGEIEIFLSHISIVYN